MSRRHAQRSDLQRALDQSVGHLIRFEIGQFFVDEQRGERLLNQVE